METSGQLHAAAAILSVIQPWYAFCKRLDAVQKRGIFCFCRESNPDFLVVQMIKPTDLRKLKYKCIRICLICHVDTKLCYVLCRCRKGSHWRCWDQPYSPDAQKWVPWVIRPQGNNLVGRIKSMSNPNAPSGIEPATFRLVAQSLNQLRHRALRGGTIRLKKSHSEKFCDIFIKSRTCIERYM